MNHKELDKGKGSFFSRRHFLGACAACAAYGCTAGWARGAGRLFRPEASSSQGLPGLPHGKARVRLVFCHEPPENITWPYLGYDYESRKRELQARLVSSCPGIEFLPVTWKTRAEAESGLGAGPDVDGYLVYLVGIWTGVPRTIAYSGRPTLLVDDHYAGSGEFLIEYARAKREGQRVVGVSSSRFEDVVDALKSFEVIHKLKSSLILDVNDAETLRGDPQTITEVLGPRVERVYSQEIRAAYEAADLGQGARWAKQWMDDAEKVVEPKREEIERCGRMYLAEMELLRKHEAQALTIDCLGLYYAGKLPAYPCLGFFQLNNDGFVGACEADVPSTATMLLMTYLAGRPGYISDPVVDTAKGEIIYAHCVAPNKVFGPGGPSNPYQIRSHSEDRQGAAVRSILPLGEMTTTLDFNPARREFVFHQAVSSANIDEDKACRTKLSAMVMGDVERLLGEWDRFGWHRVTVFGDYRKEVERTAALLGVKLVYEA